MFETPALAAIIAGVRQEWVQTILETGPVENYVKKFIYINVIIFSGHFFLIIKLFTIVFILLS